MGINSLLYSKVLTKVMTKLGFIVKPKTYRALPSVRMHSVATSATQHFRRLHSQQDINFIAPMITESERRIKTRKNNGNRFLHNKEIISEYWETLGSQIFELS